MVLAATGAMSKFNDTIAGISNGTTTHNNSGTSIPYGNSSIYGQLQDVEYRPIQPALWKRSEQQIINSISGGDMTQGSCSSLALAYAGNRAGYVVYDFRDGQSREFFSSRSSIEQIANISGVN